MGPTGAQKEVRKGRRCQSELVQPLQMLPCHCSSRNGKGAESNSDHVLRVKMTIASTATRFGGAE